MKTARLLMHRVRGRLYPASHRQRRQFATVLSDVITDLSARVAVRPPRTLLHSRVATVDCSRGLVRVNGAWLWRLGLLLAHDAEAFAASLFLTIGRALRRDAGEPRESADRWVGRHIGRHGVGAGALARAVRVLYQSVDAHAATDLVDVDQLWLGWREARVPTWSARSTLVVASGLDPLR